MQYKASNGICKLRWMKKNKRVNETIMQFNVCYWRLNHPMRHSVFFSSIHINDAHGLFICFHHFENTASMSASAQQLFRGDVD